MAKILEGIQKCSRCNETYNWEIIVLEKGDQFISGIPKCVSNYHMANNKKYTVFVSCPHCGKEQQLHNIEGKKN